ncbi:MAG: lipopolysaccharide biosynthesis protein [Actinomycetota bacterium]
MYGYLKRLLKTGAAYQVAEAVAKIIALILLPIYTRYLTPADYGTADLLLTLVILVSIVGRLGVIEAFVRFYYVDDDQARRDRVARASTAIVFITTTVICGLSALFAAQLSKLVLGFEDSTLWMITTLGLWSFTNLEMAYALLRVDEMTRIYIRASLINVGLTVGLSLWLVVGEGDGASGLLAGNFIASTVVLFGLWWKLRHRVGIRIDAPTLSPMLRFGLPTVPAEVSVFALNLIDRTYLYRVESPKVAGLYSLSIKLAAVVIFATRAFQYAWPPLAYSITDDNEAGRLYALVATYYVLVTGIIVAGLTLLGRWAVRLLAAPDFFDAFESLPWVSLGWAMYGLFLIFVVIAGRAKVTKRNFPAAAAGLVVNVGLLFLLVPTFGIAGAGAALCGAYLVMLILMYFLTRNLFTVGFEWIRLVQLIVVIGGLTVAGELVLPTDGVVGFLSRLAVWVAIPLVLLVTRFFPPAEIKRLRELGGRLRRASAQSTPAVGPRTEV